jgi:hypothetical protein
MSRHALKITLTTDRHGHPLATIDFPGLDVAMYAPQLRTMAGQMLRAADDLDRQSGAVSDDSTDNIFDALLAVDRIEGLVALLMIANFGDADTGVTDRQIQGVSDCLMNEIRHIRIIIEAAQS